jgi:hypothetical protein
VYSQLLVSREALTAVEVAFQYGKAPGTAEMRAIESVRDVYGIRRIVFNESERTLRVEYDATRLTEDSVAALLRQAGIDVTEKLRLA